MKKEEVKISDTFCFCRDRGGFPIDLTKLYDSSNWSCEYSNEDETYTIHYEDKEHHWPIIKCKNRVQATTFIKAFRSGQKAENTPDILEHIAGTYMSEKVFKEDYYYSGRENWNYQLVWLPGSEIDKIINALESKGEHGLAALIRMGKVE